MDVRILSPYIEAVLAALPRPIMYLTYPELIAEDPNELARLERHYRHTSLVHRLQMLRLLKTGAYRSRRALAQLRGYSERQLQRWFATYRQGGLEALLEQGAPGGRPEQITPEAWQALEAEMKAGHIASLQEAQRFLAEHFAITYTVGGLSDLFRRKKTKLKTGRRRNEKASAQEQEAFKKTVPGGSAEAASGTVLRHG